MNSAIIVAGGKGRRMGADKNKVFLDLAGEPVLVRTVKAFQANKKIDEIIVITGKDDIDEAKNILSCFDKISAIGEGGETRQQSVYNGIKLSKGDMLLIHDGARALISQKEIDDVIEECSKYNAAALGVMCKDTLKSVNCDGFITATVDRSSTYHIHTPQAFSRSIILSAHEKAIRDGFEATDDCALVEHYGGKIKLTEGSYNNIKLTTPIDMIIGKEWCSE